MPRRILIVGGDSEIATAAAAHLRASGYVVAATTRRPERVAVDRPFLDLSRPVGDWPIPDGVSAVCFCAAIARLNDCANNPEASALINVTGTIGLETPPCPVSEYGRQKAAAEVALGERMRAGAPVTVLRLAKIVSPGMELLRQWIVSLAGGKSIRAFDDMMMAPTPVAVAAAAIERLLAEPNPGIFQLSGPRDVAYSGVALRLAHSLGADPALVDPVSAYSAGLPPGSTAQHTTLDSSALRERFGIAVPDAWAVIDELLETCR